MTVLLAPVTGAPARPLGGRTFRKQILKAGQLDYPTKDGRTRRLVFDQAYFTDLATAFRDGAYDAVKAIMAPDSNAHTMDPERMRGDVVDLVPSEDGSGLDAIMTLSEETARLVEQHPDLGVSARITEGRTRGDGKAWPRAIQHVLLTLDPRVTGLKPWKSVDLSHDGHDVVDLSSAVLETGRGQDVAELSDSDIERIVSRLSERMNGASGEEQDAEPDGDEVWQNWLADDDVEEFFAEEADDDGDGGYADADLVGAGADLSTFDDDPRFVDLATTNAALSGEVAQMRAELSAARWQTEREQLLHQGVPPAMLDLAAPVLEADHAGTVIDLSNGSDTIDAADVVRGLLREAAGIVDLSTEVGHGQSVSGDTSDTAAAHQVWESQYGRGN